MNYSIEEILEAVKEYGTKTEAARVLGIPRTTLTDRIKRAEPFLEKEAKSLGFSADDVSGYWVKSKQGSYYVRRDIEYNYNDLREDFIKDAAVHAPVYSKFNYEVFGDHLLIIDPADVHFGKLSVSEETGFNYNLEVSVKRVRQGITNLLSKASVHGISEIVFVLGNDVLHIDNPKRTTTSGTGQDTDGQWFEAFKIAKSCYIACIEELTSVAPVHLVHCPSNHDFMSGWMLSDSICSHFSNNPNVISKDGSVSIAHRKYVQFGSNLIGFTHNDGAKESDLPNLMQYEAREAWGVSRYAYWYLHHFHHKDRKTFGKSQFKIEKDHIGVTVIQAGKKQDPNNSTYTEVVRSPSAPDRWHVTNGYVNEQAMECFLHHPDKGQVARFTEYF